MILLRNSVKDNCHMNVTNLTHTYTRVRPLESHELEFESCDSNELAV